MSGMALSVLPAPARDAWSHLRDTLHDVLADDLVALWAHGGTTSIGDPAHAGDLDTHAILARAPEEAIARRLEAAEEMTAAAHGVTWDTWYVLDADARGSEPPRHAWRDGRRDTSWALHRAHWLAGRHVTLHGPDPADIVTPPTWEELVAELDRELEHVERHVLEGDTDPYEATYAHLTGCRILHALETRSVAISKRAAGAWGLEHLPSRWHAALRAAIDTYEGRGTAAAHELLAGSMPRFVELVRRALPTDRPSGSIPRWSGY